MLEHFIGGLHELAIQHRIFGVQWFAQSSLLAAKSLFKQPGMEKESLGWCGGPLSRRYISGKVFLMLVWPARAPSQRMLGWSGIGELQGPTRIERGRDSECERKCGR